MVQLKVEKAGNKTYQGSCPRHPLSSCAAAATSSLHRLLAVLGAPVSLRSRSVPSQKIVVSIV